MGTTSRGTLTQNFRISLDLTKLREYLEEQIIRAIESETTRGRQTFTEIEIDESYYDGENLVIEGKYDTAFEHWYCRATLESPEENDYDYESIDGWDDKALLSELPVALKELITVDDAEANEDGVELHWGYEDD